MLWAIGSMFVMVVARMNGKSRAISWVHDDDLKEECARNQFINEL